MLAQAIKSPLELKQEYTRLHDNNLMYAEDHRSRVVETNSAMEYHIEKYHRLMQVCNQVRQERSKLRMKVQ